MVHVRTMPCQMIWCAASNPLSHLTDTAVVTAELESGDLTESSILNEVREATCSVATKSCLDISRDVIGSTHGNWVVISNHHGATVGLMDCGRNEALQCRR